MPQTGFSKNGDIPVFRGLAHMQTTRIHKGSYINNVAPLILNVSMCFTLRTFKSECLI